MRPDKVLMCEPKYFEVNYTGNEFMKDNFNKIDKAAALKQWQELKEVYEKLGFPVTLIDPAEEMVDMVFTANQSLPLLNGNEKTVVLSRMRNPERKDEIQYFKRFYEKEGYTIIELPDKIKSFESMGDAVIDYERNIIFGGYGPRTDKAVYEYLTNHLDYNIVTLQLINPFLYHLDTCFSILNSSTVVLDETGFSEKGLQIIRSYFENVIAADPQENLKHFVCNCHCPEGKNIILQKGSTKFKADVESKGFNVMEVETGEFIKSGGSVFCMKMMYY